MKKAYYIFNPEEFEIFDCVDKNGNIFKKKIENFNMIQKEDNILIFEGKKRTFLNEVSYGSNVKELVSGNKYKIKIVKEKNNSYSVCICSRKNKYILSKPQKIEDSIISGQRVSGFLRYLKKENLINDYVAKVIEFNDTISSSIDEYNKIINGPTLEDKEYLKKIIKSLY